MAKRLALLTGLAGATAALLSPFLELPRLTYRNGGLLEIGWVMAPYCGFQLLAFLTRKSVLAGSIVLVGLAVALAMAGVGFWSGYVPGDTDLAWGGIMLALWQLKALGVTALVALPVAFLAFLRFQPQGAGPWR